MESQPCWQGRFGIPAGHGADTCTPELRGLRESIGSMGQRKNPASTRKTGRCVVHTKMSNVGHQIRHSVKKKAPETSFEFPGPFKCHTISKNRYEPGKPSSGI